MQGSPSPKVDEFINEIQKEFQEALGQPKDPETGAREGKAHFEKLFPKYFPKYQELRKSLTEVTERFKLDFFFLNITMLLEKEDQIAEITGHWKGFGLGIMTLAAASQMVEFQKGIGSVPKLPGVVEKILGEVAKSEDKQMAAEAKRLTDPFFLNPVGKPFPAFPPDLTTLDGKPLSLDRFKGKILLVDFWATWCGPCKRAMPEVVKAFKAYNEKGFEVLGISLDQEKSELEKYTKENGMIWPQFFDGKGWENQVSRHYGVMSIPAMYLIGKDGAVIAGPDEVRRKPLDQRLEELLGK